MLRLLALPLLVVALHPQEPAIGPLPAPLEATLADGFWQRGCPVPLLQNGSNGALNGSHGRYPAMCVEGPVMDATIVDWERLP